MKDAFAFDNEVESDKFEVDGTEDFIDGQFKELTPEGKF
jgi:hypothetical protein